MKNNTKKKALIESFEWLTSDAMKGDNAKKKAPEWLAAVKEYVEFKLEKKT